MLPADPANVNETELRLVDDRRRLKSVPSALLLHVTMRQPAELVVDHGNQLV
jgi:hypothetical protein